MTIERYTPQLIREWDDAVKASRNGTFLHLRGYMDYHADRFDDFSLVARDGKGRIVAVLPAARRGDELASHPGLTYGGWLLTPRADAEAMLEIWSQMTEFLKCEGFKNLIYKPSPHIYHKYPAEEDLYAMFRHGGGLESTLISSVLPYDNPLPFDMASRQSVRKAEKAGIVVGKSDDFEGFWHVLEALLSERYDTRPVHTIDEIRLLHSRFLDNITLYTAAYEGEIVAGVVIYATDTVAHSQYTATTANGREMRALPLLYSHIIDQYRDRRYFDFGTSNEDSGRVLNLGLIRQKAGFGARGITQNTYRISLI